MAVSVSASRRAAFEILMRVEGEDAYASELLHSAKLDKLSAEDRGLAQEIVMGVLRWRSRLDQEIAFFSFTPLRKLDAAVLTALRMGVYQLRYLDRVPVHAAVDESVEMVKSSGKTSAAGLTNVVLRKIAGKKSIRESANPTLGAKNALRMGHPLSETSNTPIGECANPTLRAQPPQHSRRALGAPDHARRMGRPEFEVGHPESHLGLSRMAEELAHPGWMVERWAVQFGEARARGICEFDQQRPVTHIRIRAGNDVAAVLKSLRAEGVELAPGAMVDSCWHILSGEVTRTSAWKYRRIAIQDEGSQLVAQVAAASVERPQRILDCCAAPGGKTMLLAEAHPEARVVALELHPHRVETLKKLCNAPNVEIVQGDATRFSAEEAFDLVLADVPCSGTGTLGRNPEIKWRLKPEKFGELQELQFCIARNALKQTKAGGVLVYSTCSLEREENEAVVERLVREGGCEVVRDLRTMPGEDACDGFFAAVVRKGHGSRVTG